MRRILRLPALLPLVLFVPLLTAAQTDPDRDARAWMGLARETLGEEGFQAAGLDKLEPAEVEHLLNRVFVVPGRSTLEDAAFRRLEKQGWRPVHIMGGVRTGPFESDGVLFLSEGYGLIRLKPFGASRLLPPGEYWAKNIISSWTILDATGEERSYSALDR
jgi:hypothetical protein